MSRRTLAALALLAALSPSLAAAAPAAPAPAVSPAPASAPDPAGAHAAIAQAQERLAEIDASITGLQADSDKLDAAARQQARDALTALRTLRDTYRKEIDGVVAQGRQMTADQLRVARAALDAPWTQFQSALDADVVSFKLDVAGRKALIEARVKAEETYWQGVATDLKGAAANLTAEQRAAIDARLAVVQGHVEAARLRLSRLAGAGRTAWTALKQGFITSGHILDDAYRANR